MRHRFRHLFGNFENGDGDDSGKDDSQDSAHPLDEWMDWIINRHPMLVNDMIDEVKEMEVHEDDLAGPFVAAGRAMLYAGCQFFFDTATGVIYPSLDKEDRKEEFPEEDVLYNLIEMRQRAHEVVDQLFNQYTDEYKQMKALEKEADEEDSELDEGDSWKNEDDDSD